VAVSIPWSSKASAGSATSSLIVSSTFLDF
jgi:hypothetical protein